MVFFTPEQLATMHDRRGERGPGRVMVEIYNKAKAAAGA